MFGSNLTTTSAKATPTRAFARRANRRNRGAMLIYEMVVMIAVIGFMSLGIDVGRVQIVKAQLRSAADAAALAAGDSINRGETSAQSILAAINTAAANDADGSPVVLLPTDVLLGHWDMASQTFTAGATPIDSAKVTAKRSASRGSAVSLTFAAIIGFNSCDATAVAIARSNDHVPSQAFVGLSHFSSSGLLTTDSYTSGHSGDVASNGNIKLNLLGLVGLTYIDGDCNPGAGYSIQKPMVGVTTITGNQSTLTNPLVATTVDAGYYATHNDNSSLPSALLSGSNDLTVAIVVDIPAGTYYLRNLTILAGAIMRINGATTFYVTGNTTMAAGVIVLNNDPANFRVKVAGSGAVNLVAGVNVYMTLYAPESQLYITVGVNYTGSFVAKTVDILATSFLHYPETSSTAIPIRGSALVS